MKTIEQQFVSLCKGPLVDVRKISPELAEYLFTNRAPNRKLSKTAVEKFINSMSDKQWWLANNVIALNAQNRLVDGQKRMFAQMVSQTSQDYIIRRNMETHELAVIDGPTPRTTKQQVSFVPGLNDLVDFDISKYVTPIRWLLALGENKKTLALNTYDFKPLLEYFKESIVFVEQTIKGRKLIRVIPECSYIVGALIRAHKHGVSPQRIKNAINVLIDGEPDGKIDSSIRNILKLRNWLLTGEAGGHKHRYMTYWIGELYLDAFFTNKPLIDIKKEKLEDKNEKWPLSDLPNIRALQSKKSNVNNKSRQKTNS